MKIPGYLSIAALIIPAVAVSPGAAMQMDIDMAAVSGSDTIICAATHQYQSEQITIRRVFKLDGAEVIGSGQDSKRTGTNDNKIAALIRQQLFDYVTGMVKTRDKDCSPNNLDDGNEVHVFDCSENWQEGSSRFLVSNNVTSWNYGEGTNWRLSMRWPNLSYPEEAGNQPQLTVYVPSGWQPGAASTQSIPVQGNRENQAKTQSVKLSDMIKVPAPAAPINVPKNWAKPKSVEVRAGNVTYSRKIAGPFDIPYSDWSKLLQAGGDIEITVYGDKKGAVLKKIFPRSIYISAEEKIQTGHRAMIEKARNNLTSCKRLDSWEGGEDQMIVVT